MARTVVTPPYPRLLEATRALDTPFALIDEVALWANAEDLLRRAGSVPIRVASKSIRVRSIIKNALTLPGFAGVLSYSLAESNWLADNGVDDILVAYPSMDQSAYRELVADERRLAAITVMVDSIATLDMIDSFVGKDRPPIRVCLDVDSSLRILGAHLGAHRSPVHTTRQTKQLAATIAARAGFDLVGLMFYDAQIAGMPDDGPAIKLVKSRSAAELRRRRKRIVRAVSQITELQIINAGGTGSLDVWNDDPNITELAAGSGLFVPTLFDNYRDFMPRPAAFFALSVVRKPSESAVTCFGGGYIASGPAGASRVPSPVWPHGLELYGAEGAGEVQTPLRGKSAKALQIGDRVLFRHAKAGEMCERFNQVAIVDSAGDINLVPTYRGEGKNFG